MNRTYKLSLGRERRHVLSFTNPEELKNETDKLQADFDEYKKERDKWEEKYPRIQTRKIQQIKSKMNKIAKRVDFRSKTLIKLIKSDTNFKSLETKIECGTEDLSGQISIQQ